MIPKNYKTPAPSPLREKLLCKRQSGTDTLTLDERALLFIIDVEDLFLLDHKFLDVRGCSLPTMGNVLRSLKNDGQVLIKPKNSEDYNLWPVLMN